MVSALDYRAWGALQRADYGNGRRLALGYNQKRSQLGSLKLRKTDDTDVVTNLSYDYYSGGGSGGNNGRVRYITDSLDGNCSVDISYDGHNRLRRTATTNTTNVINTLTYRGFGGVKSLNFGSNPRLMQVSYDAKRQQMTNLYIRHVTNTSDVIVNSTYDYYNGGNNNGRIQKVTDNTDSTYTTTYGYDAYNRLTSATATAYTRSYAYDNGAT